ncbi:hypothetical protein ABFX02_10G129800 [Erythranthe guttata]
MASLKLSVSPEHSSFHESKKLTSAVIPFKFASSVLFSGYFSTNGALIVKPFCELKHIRVSKLRDEFLDTSDSILDGYSIDNLEKCVDADDNLIVQDRNSNGEFDRARIDIWKTFRGVNKARRSANRNLDIRRDGNKYKKGEKFTTPLERNRVLGGDQTLVDIDLDDVGPDLSSERCNLILEQLERSNDSSKALTFFDWMKANGKLKKNVTAYNSILRVLGRKTDWNGAEIMIKEMISESSCELNYQVFNTLIYACNKSGLVDMGTRWFKIMLDYNVRPNVATFGMLMSLYQKGCHVEEAEYTFSRMRNLKIICQSAYSSMITIYTRTRLYDKAEDVICFLKEDEVVLNKENWLVVLNCYCQQGKLDDAELALRAMKEAGLSPCIVAYNTMITGYGRVSSMDQSERLLDNLKETGLVPDETTYRSLIEGWGRTGNYEKAKFYYTELEKFGFKPNSSNLYTLIRLQAKHEDEVGAIRTINDMLMIGCQKSSILGIVLQAYEKADRLIKMSAVLEGPMYDHVLKNQTSCTILVTAYVKSSLIDNAMEVLRKKKWKDRVFEDNLYHLLICSCKDLGHLENAVKIFTCMPKSDKPNMNTFCTMIDVYSKMALFSEAEKLYTELKASDIKLDMIAFSVVIRMYVKSGSLKEACAVLEIMDGEKNIVPDVYLLRDILRIYQRCGMEDKLADLYYKVLRNGEIWDEEMYNCVINCCARALPVDELSRLFDEMLQRGFLPSTITFNVMLHVYGKSRLFEKAKGVFWMAKKRGLIDVISYNTLIAVYGKNKYLKNMSAAVTKMQFDGFSVSLEAYNCMLDAYGKQGEMDKFKSVLQRMKLSNCSSDRYTYNILINIYGEKGWIEEVANVLAELKEYGIGPDLCSYNTLIKAYGIAGMVEDAVALVKEMRENGIEPDRLTYTNLITALRKNDMFLEAVKWSLWMKQMGL